MSQSDGDERGEALGQQALGVPVYATVPEALDDLDAAARERSVGVVASGNFSLTAAMCQAAALLAARHLPQWELIAVRGAPGLVGLTRGLDALLLS